MPHPPPASPGYNCQGGGRERMCSAHRHLLSQRRTHTRAFTQPQTHFSLCHATKIEDNVTRHTSESHWMIIAFIPTLDMFSGVALLSFPALSSLISPFIQNLKGSINIPESVSLPSNAIHRSIVHKASRSSARVHKKGKSLSEPNSIASSDHNLLFLMSFIDSAPHNPLPSRLY